MPVAVKNWSSWQKSNHFVIVEDDPYGGLLAEAREKTLLQGLLNAVAEITSYTSTFSKILAPSLRVGWIVLPEWMKQKSGHH